MVVITVMDLFPTFTNDRKLSARGQFLCRESVITSDTARTVRAAFVAATDLQYVAPDVVSEGPAKSVQDVEHLFLLEHGEEAVEEDLEPDGNRLGAVQHQAADVEHHVGLDDLHLGWVVEVLGAQLVQGWKVEQVTT